MYFTELILILFTQFDCFTAHFQSDSYLDKKLNNKI